MLGTCSSSTGEATADYLWRRHALRWTEFRVTWEVLMRPGISRNTGLGLVALLSATATSIVEPAAAQVEREQRVLLSPNVVCRASPSHAASVVGFLGPNGDRGGAGRPIEFLAGDISDTVEGWIHLRPDDVKSARLPVGCWIPESVVAPIEQYSPTEDDLLYVADRLLSAPEGRPLRDWVDAYNMLHRPWNRKMVESSAILRLRRLELLGRALQAVESDGAFGPGPGSRDPLVLTWFESLEDEVRYDARGLRRTWMLSSEAFDALYEKYRDDPLAEEILWKAAWAGYPWGNCRQDVECLFDIPLRGLSKYWLTYPAGMFVSDAARMALELLRGAGGRGFLRACSGARDAEAPRSFINAWTRLKWEDVAAREAQRLLESLGEVREEDKAPLIGYLNEVAQCAAEVPAPAAAAEETAPVPARRTRALAIIGVDVLCRAEPTMEPTLRGAVLPLDYHFSAERADTTAGGSAWTHVPGRNCWVQTSQTAPGDTDEHVLAIADRFASKGEGRSLDNLLRVYNVLSGRYLGHADEVSASPILMLRRLQLLRVWLRSVGRFDADPLALAVVRSLDEEVRPFESGAVWMLRSDVFLSLHENYRGQPGAEESLWELASERGGHDCEGQLACFVHAEVMGRLARYWLEYPQGRYVAEGVGRARDLLVPALDGCRAAHTAGPGSREARRWGLADWEQTGAGAVQELRESLSQVSEEDKAPLIELLDDLEACAEAVLSPVPLQA